MSTRNGALIVNRPGDRTNGNGTPDLVGLTDATSNVGPLTTVGKDWAITTGVTIVSTPAVAKRTFLAVSPTAW